VTKIAVQGAIAESLDIKFIKKMKLDIEFHKGSPEKPGIIFIHGLGMDKNLWASPCDARIGGGLFPFTILIREKPETLRLKGFPPILPERLTPGIPPSGLSTSYHDLKKEDYTVITWTQRRPVGPIGDSVEELRNIVEFMSMLTNRVILIGHSRGGLIARKYLLESGDRRVKALITIATPHRGSTMAEWVRHLSLIGTLLNPFLSHFPEGKISKAIKRISDFLKSDAIRELLPQSSFIKSLNCYFRHEEPQLPLSPIKTYSIVGTDPHLFTIYKWKIKKSEHEYLVSPEPLFSFPEDIVSRMPEDLVPKEWRSGYGDGLVNVESARFGEVCYEFKLNHANILTDKEVRGYLLKIVKELTS